jgi:hypothetical protein
VECVDTRKQESVDEAGYLRELTEKKEVEEADQILAEVYGESHQVPPRELEQRQAI